MIYQRIQDLLDYGKSKELLSPMDETYAKNRILEILHLDDFIEEMAPQNTSQKAEHTDVAKTEELSLETILRDILDWAFEKGILTSDSVVYRDLLDTKLMGAVVPLPSTVNAKFRQLYAESPQKATQFYYQFSRDTDYIRTYRVARDRRWTTDTEYGVLDVTINLSKPEKDPKAIAAARNAKTSTYPKCLLCPENEGYAGRINHPARQNHRIISIDIVGEKWGFQYSPYVYYPEHCIVFNQEHVPMKIDASAFRKLFDFVRQFPHYFLGSNADLPIVGGSILAHEHFQGGHFEFAMERASIREKVIMKGYEDVEAGIVNWPMSVLRLRHKDSQRLVELASHILDCWRGYSDETVQILAQSDGEPHNTITPIVRRRGEAFEIDLVLRNNRTSEEYPLGIFHPHQELHHIKKENIGLIEVMGLAVLPARLKEEMDRLAAFILEKKDIRADAMLSKHADWVEGFLPHYAQVTKENIQDILQKEIGQVFKTVLEHAGVYKNTEQGQEAFHRFVQSL